jgi:hypothetical protein
VKNEQLDASINPADAVRDIGCVMQPDPRSTYFSVIEQGRSRSATLQDQVDAIAPYMLNPAVPESVRVHFETAKNLYVYAWFVYRFHPVAEQQALATLEFALRERLILLGAVRRDDEQVPGLRKLLKHALARGLIGNDRFPNRERWALGIAKHRFGLAQIAEMQRLGLTEMEIDDSAVLPTQQDLDYDWIGAFMERLPGIRNAYAHGSSMLHRTVIHTFEIVCDLVNQLFAPRS